MFFQSTIVFVAISAVLVLAGMFYAKNKSHFLLGAAILTIAWQGGLHVEVFKMDFTLTHFIFLLLFVWNFIEGRKKSQLAGTFNRPIYFWGAMILFAIVAMMTAIDKFQAVTGVMRPGLDLVIFFAIMKSMRKPVDVKFLGNALMFSLIFQGILATLQYKFPDFRFGVIDQNQSWMWWRAKGTFFHPNEMGMYAMMFLPFVARVLFYAIMRQDKKEIWLSGTAFLLGGIALFATGNRGSWAGLVFGMSVMLTYDMFKTGKAGTKLKKVLAGLAIPAVLFLFFFAIKYGSVMMDRIFYSDREGIGGDRLRYQEEAIEMIKNYPVTGVGYNNYLYHVDTYFVHNLYLLSAAEIGVPGALSLVGFLVILVGYTIKGMKSKIFYISNLSRGILAGILGFMLASMPGPDFWISHPIQMYFWSLAALQVALLRADKGAAMHGLRLNQKRGQSREAQANIQVVSATPPAEKRGDENASSRQSVYPNIKIGGTTRQD